MAPDEKPVVEPVVESSGEVKGKPALFGGKVHRWTKETARKASEKGVAVQAAIRSGKGQPVSSSQWRKSVESAIRWIMTHSPDEQPRNNRWLIAELRQFKEEDRAAFYRLMTATLPAPPKVVPEAVPVTKTELIGDTLEALEKELEGGVEGVW